MTLCWSVEFCRRNLTFLVWIKLQFAGVRTDRHRDDVVLILIIWFPSVRLGATRGQFFSDDTRTDLSNSSSDPACLNGAKHWLAKTEEGEEWGQTSLLHSHWSRNVKARLSLVESFIVLMMPALLCHKEPARRIQSALWNAQYILLAPRWFFMA